MELTQMGGRRLRLAVLFLVLLSTGCSSRVGKTSAPLATPRRTSTPLVSTDLVPTQIPSPSPFTTAMTSTPLPVSTLSVAQAEATLLDLLENNGGCRLPCWWGLTPGETSFIQTKSLMDKLQSIAIANFDNEGGVYSSWSITRDQLQLYAEASGFFDSKRLDPLHSLQISTKIERKIEGGFETVWDTPLNSKLLHAYMLPEILSTYGQPKGVLVFANKGGGSDRIGTFDLVLDYSDKGIAIWYRAPLEHVGDNYVGCMHKAYSDLYLWQAEQAYTWAEGVVSMSGGGVDAVAGLNRDFRPLHEVAPMTNDEFYQTFKEPDNTRCVQTAVEVWPGP